MQNYRITVQYDGTKYNGWQTQKNAMVSNLYEKLGFTKVRVNYGSWRDQLGVLQDSVDYEMTREQFEQNI